jgi:fructose-bisphosphate aldolase class II
MNSQNKFVNKSLKQYLVEAKKNNVAIGHFNISNSDGFWAVVLAAKELNLPVIIGVSEGERDFIGVYELAAMVKAYRESTGQPVFLNADHTYSFERVKEAVDAGYDAVIFDGTELSYEENITVTKKCVDYARSVNPEIIVEAEIGFIGKSSKVLDTVPEGVGRLTTVDEAVSFVKETGVDMLAPAVGNVHGMVKGGEPALNIDRIREISSVVNIPIVLHGASGNSVDDIRRSIEAGINIIHINTELRVAFRSGLTKSLQEDPDQVAPYKYFKGARIAMQKVVEEKLKLFNNIV